MYSDKDLGALDSEAGTEDGSQEDNLEWLLEMEESDSDNGLFQVEGDDFADEGLSAYEAEVASRPMTRGNERGDDLANFIAEEIVISSDTAANDIYGVTEESEQDTAPEDDGKSMAIDFTRRNAVQPQAEVDSLDEGADVLGLTSDDTIGDKPMALKRIKATPARKTQPATQKAAAQKKATEVVAEQQSVEYADDSKRAAASTAANKTASGAATQQETVARTTSALDDQEHLYLGSVANDAQSLAAAVGATVESSNVRNDDTVPKLDDLAEAPTTAQIADPAQQRVANEDSRPADGLFDDRADALSGLDDKAFDDYLLETGSTPVDELDVDFSGLTLGDIEDELALDTSSDMAFDLHEDFGQLDTMSHDTALEIAALIPSLIGEVHEVATQRLQALNLNAEHLAVDVKLASTDADVANCKEQGFELIAEVMPQLPSTLLTLSEQDSRTVFVRLQNTPENRDWNLLFDPGFGKGDDAPEIDPPVDEAATAATAVISDTTADAVEGFGDDIFGEDFTEFGAAESAGDSFADSVESPVSLDVAGHDLEGFGDDIFGEDLADFDALEAALPDTAETGVSAVSEGIEPQGVEGFGDDIFGDDLADFGVPEAAAPMDSPAAALAAAPQDTEGFGEDIFGDDFADFGAVEAEEPTAAETDTPAPAIDTTPLEVEGFDDDIFGDDLADISALADEAPTAAVAASEIEGFGEDIFGDEIAGFEIDDAAPVAAEVDTTAEPLDVPGGDLEGFTEDSRDNEAVSDVAAAATTVEPAGAVDQVEGFGEDLFDDDISAEFSEELKEGNTGFFFDIDDAFSALSQADEDQGGAICGVDLEEFGEEESEAAPLVDAEDSQIEAVEPSPEVVLAEPVDTTDLSWCVPDNIKFNFASQGGGEIFAEFLDAFIEEGSAEVEKLEDLICELEKDVVNEEVFSEVGRTLHTIKGIAKGVGLQRFGTLIHNFETLLDALPRPEQGEEQSYLRIINVWLDAVVRGIEYVEAERNDVVSELPDLGGGADTQKQKTQQAVEQKRARIETEHDIKVERELADEGVKALASQQSVRITSEKLDHLLNLASQTQQLSVRASQIAKGSKRSASELQGRLSSVRTHIGKIADRSLLDVTTRGNSKNALDALEMDQYSELQEAASILREGVEDLGDLIDLVSRQNTQVETLLKQQSSVVSSISSAIQGARVVPVSRLMPGLRRIVRTVSNELGKTVNFRVLNETGSLDRDHYARLQVVLEHMVRNAMDHGIEPSDKRLAAGKAEAGQITIDVRKSGGNYIIRLSDDGRGMDPDAIRESAYEKGIDVDVDALSDDEALRLIFHKGFSTAETVSEISGRGVGMDIVLSELQHIGGDIQIHSVPGEGTTFEVNIPSSVTVNGALMVTAGDRSYAIPLNGLIAVEQIPADEYFAAVKNGESLSLYDMECKPAYLATLCEGVSLPERSFWEAFVPVIIAGSDGRHMAIAIDSVQEALELVVRSLGSQFSTVPGLAGAATTADGEAIVALDLNLLVDDVRIDGTASVAERQEAHGNLLALVVDDSRTQRMVATSQLDTIGVETVTAENGQVAIDLLNATHRLPDVVLLDVEMPVKDGIETLREIRKSQRYGHVPVIMVTSRTGVKHRALAKDAGCSAYMGKPFNFPALVEQINVLTGYNLQLS